MLTLRSQAELTLEAARDRLSPPPRRAALLPALAASALLAVSALGLAAVVILGPPAPWAALVR